VLATLKSAAEQPPIADLPRLPKRDGTEGFDEIQLELFDRLKDWRKSIAEEHGIESSYLLNRHVMASIAREKPRGERALEAIDGLLDWQLEWFAKDLIELLEEFHRAVERGEISRQRTKKRWR